MASKTDTHNQVVRCAQELGVLAEKSDGRWTWSIGRKDEHFGHLQYHPGAKIWTARRSDRHMERTREVTAGDLVGCIQFLIPKE